VAKLHVGILAAPILGSLITGNPGFWLVFRAGSLSFGGCLQISEKEFVEENLKSERFSRFVAFTKKPVVQIPVMILNVALILFASFVK
jgi:hypothetical protein